MKMMISRNSTYLIKGKTLGSIVTNCNIWWKLNKTHWINENLFLTTILDKSYSTEQKIKFSINGFNGFDHIYWKYLDWKTSFFVLCKNFLRLLFAWECLKRDLIFDYQSLQLITESDEETFASPKDRVIVNQHPNFESLWLLDAENAENVMKTVTSSW